MKGGHTDRIDIPEGIWNGVNVSKQHQIKTTKENSICCSDIRKFYKTIKEGVVLSVGCYLQEGNLKKLYEVYEFDVKPKHHKLIYDTITYEELDEFHKYVKGISYGYQAQQENKLLWKEKRSDILFGTDSLIGIDTKIDSKTQRRVQCSLKINDLLNTDIPYRIYRESYKGIELPYYINSSEREFKKNPYEENSKLFFDYDYAK